MKWASILTVLILFQPIMPGFSSDAQKKVGRAIKIQGEIEQLGKMSDDCKRKIKEAEEALAKLQAEDKAITGEMLRLEKELAKTIKP